MRNASETRSIQNQNTRSTLHNYGIKWENKIQPDRSQMVI